MPPSTDILGAIALVAENKIQAAYEDGAFDHLPGKGQPWPWKTTPTCRPNCAWPIKSSKTPGT